MVEVIAQHEEIRNARLLVFVDKTKELNALDRTYRNYEWNGIVKAAFRDEVRYSFDYKNWHSHEKLISRKEINKYYIAGDFDPGVQRRPLFVIIERSRFKNPRDFWLKLIVSPAEAFVLKTTSNVNFSDY